MVVREGRVTMALKKCWRWMRMKVQLPLKAHAEAEKEAGVGIDLFPCLPRRLYWGCRGVSGRGNGLFRIQVYMLNLKRMLLRLRQQILQGTGSGKPQKSSSATISRRMVMKTICMFTGMLLLRLALVLHLKPVAVYIRLLRRAQARIRVSGFVSYRERASYNIWVMVSGVALNNGQAGRMTIPYR